MSDHLSLIADFARAAMPVHPSWEKSRQVGDREVSTGDVVRVYQRSGLFRCLGFVGDTAHLADAENSFVRVPVGDLRERFQLIGGEK